MADILVDMFPAHGHFNGSFDLARLLHNSGRSVCYACTGEFAEKVLEAGFSTYLINPFIIPPDPATLKEKGILRYLMENWVTAFTDEKHRYIEKNIKEYDDMIRKLRPALIMLDEHYAYKSIFYWKYHIPVITVQTAVSPDYAPGIPPFVNPTVPDFSKIDKLYVEYLWAGHILKKWIRRLAGKMLAMGKTNGYFYRYYAGKYAFPYQNILRKRSTGIRFKHIPALVIPPEAFDFPRVKKENLYFIGPLNHQRYHRDRGSNRLEQIFDLVLKERENSPDTKLVYCSLGTVTGNYLDVCKNFFRQISKVCKRNPHLHVILSVGIYFDIALLGNTPANLYVFNRVPQLRVLQKCDFVITHGGMNTIFESIMAEKPLIVFPLSMEWDQNGNAARVVYHGIGLKGILRKATSGSIEKLIRQLILNYEKYRAHISLLKSRFEDRSEYMLRLIDGFIKNGIKC